MGDPLRGTDMDMEIKIKEEILDEEYTCSPLEDHEFMFIEKEEPEFDERENLSSVVEAVLKDTESLLQLPDEAYECEESRTAGESCAFSETITSAGINASEEMSTSAESEGLRAQELKTLPCESKFHSLPTHTTSIVPETSVAGSDATSTLTSTSEVQPVVSTVTSLQTQLRGSHVWTTAPTRNNNINNDKISASNLLHMTMLQNTLSVHNMQAAFLQRAGLTQIRMPKVRATQNLLPFASSLNQQQMNILRMGLNRLGSPPSMGVMQNRWRLAQLHSYVARCSVPRFSLQASSNGMMQRGVLQNTHVPQLRIPSCGVQHSRMSAAPINLMKNLNPSLEGPAISMRNVTCVNASHKVAEFSQERQVPGAVVSQIGGQQTQMSVSMSGSQQGFHHRAIKTAGVQHHVSVPRMSAQFGAAFIPGLAKNDPQLSSHQLRVSHLAVNALRSSVPPRPRIFLPSHVATQPLLPSQQSISQMNANLQKRLAVNMQRFASSGAHLGVASLSTNVNRPHIPLIPANVPRVNAPQVNPNVQRLNVQQITRNVLPVGMSQLSSSMTHPCVPQAVVSNVAQICVPGITTTIPGVRLPQMSSNINRLSVPQLTASVSRLSVPVGVSNLGVHPLSKPCLVRIPNRELKSNLQDVVARVKYIAQTMPQLQTRRPSATRPLSTGMMRTEITPTAPMCHRKNLQEAQYRLQQNSVLKTLPHNQKKSSCGLLVERHPRLRPHEGVSLHGNSRCLKISSVLERYAGVLDSSSKSSQQSTNGPNTVEAQKPMTGQSTKILEQRHKQKTKSIVKLLQRKHIRHQLALLRLWRRFEKYHMGGPLYDANLKKLREIRKRRRLLIQQKQVQVSSCKTNRS